MKSNNNDQQKSVNPKHAELFRKYGKKKVSKEELAEAIKVFSRLDLDAEQLRSEGWKRNL